MATSESGSGSDTAEADGTADGGESPGIDEDLIQEELRIDGICGVY